MEYGSRFRKTFEAARKTLEYWMEDVRLDFTEAIVETIKSKNISQKDLAERIGKSEAYISKIINSNTTNFTLKTMVQLCLALDSKITLKIEDIEPVKSQNHIKWNVSNSKIEDQAVATFAKTPELVKSKQEEAYEVISDADNKLTFAA